MKFEDHTLGKGIAFQVYPTHGWNAVWGAMVSRSTVVRDRIVGIRDEHKKAHVLTASGEKYHFADYHTVFCSIDIDELWGEDTLPYTGRMMIPLLIPGLASAFPEGAESLHYSSCEFQTRVTEMKVITRHESPDTLILIEVPVLPGAAQSFPKKHHRLRAREQPVRREGVSAAVRATGLRNLISATWSAGKKIPICAMSAGTRSSSTGACRKRSTPPTESARLRAGVTPRVLASTTSHKKEPLIPTLEVFAGLGLRDLDLNLHHLIEAGTPVEAVADAVATGGQRVWIVSGGWCDFFHRAPRIEDTFSSDRSAGRHREEARRWTPCVSSSDASSWTSTLPPTWASLRRISAVCPIVIRT